MQYKSSVVFFKVVFITGAFMALFLIYAFIQYKNQGIDLIQGENWIYFPGATAVAGGIHFQPFQRSIIHQDGSIGQANPPVNIGGQHLLVAGDFKITAVVSHIDKGASLRFYTAPVLVYDQWRYEPPSIDISIDTIKNVVTARIWDGASNTSMDTRTYHSMLPLTIFISLEHQKDQVSIIENGHEIISMPDHGIFDSGSIWFGTDGVYGSNGWTLDALHAKAMENGQVSIAPLLTLTNTQDDPLSLRNLADNNTHKIKIGTALAPGPLVTDQSYQDLALSQFSIITPENSMKPEFIHPEPNVYDFSESDQLVQIALKNTITVHGHALVYAKSNPDWMQKSKVGDRQHIMTDHITAVVNHFKGNVAEWDVVNEPFSEKHALYGFGKSGLDQNIWFEAMGEQYIDLAFKTAHQADPKAKLYINDYGLENDGQHWDAMLALVKRLLQRNVPIDGVGFETHIYGDGDYINPGQFTSHMQELAKLGLLTRISEIDVTQDDAKEQVNQYVTALDICLKAPNCTSYTTWGISDKYGSTTRSDRYPLVYGTSLLWDKDFKAKPAYQALQKRLQP